MMIEKIGRKAMLLQMAEETAELAQAALKLVRVMDGENPTPVTEEKAIANLREEYTDVMMCANELGIGAGEWGAYLTDKRDTVEIIAKRAARLTYMLVDMEDDPFLEMRDEMDIDQVPEIRIMLGIIVSLMGQIGIEVDQKQVGDKELRFLKRWEEAHGNS